MIVVFFIRAFIFKFASGYMRGSKATLRFLVLLLLFILSIGQFIFCPNLIRMFLGWDGLGLVSYLLVIFYSREKSLNSGLLTILRNRVGDYFLILAIFYSYLNKGGSMTYIFWVESCLIIRGLIVLAGFTKRAQIPFSSWLPMAMAAPTPVSALVHSSTLVTAGVYLLLRFNHLLSEEHSMFIFFRGVATIFIRAFSANWQSDQKKIVALSTLSNLGLMIVFIGKGLTDYCLFHLFAHALSKFFLFIRVGKRIGRKGGKQD